MPQDSWCDKRERQYQHFKESELKEGRATNVAEEIAVRTLNKEWARSGESSTASKTSLEDISSGRRGGLRSHHGAKGRTVRQLSEEARRKNIKGRFKIDKKALENAVDAS